MRGIDTIDCGYCFDEFAASFLVVESGRAAFIENNTSLAVPRLLSALGQRGLRPQDVEYIVITHVHLDHAGGTAALLAACPRATVLAHPRAARHLRDPSRLIAGARAVYGAARFDTLYGSIEPVPADRIREMQHEESLRWGQREWRFFHTRGHANHHFVLWDSFLQASFTGDAFGIYYPSLQKGGLFLFPSTSPTDFDAVQARAAIDLIAALPGDRAFLTHFGELQGLRAAADQLKEWIDFSQALVEQGPGAAFSEKINARFSAEMNRRGVLSPAAWDLTAIDRELNASGLAWAAGKTAS